MSGAPVKTVKLIALAFSLAELAVVVALWIAYRSAMGTAAEQVDVPFREIVLGRLDRRRSGSASPSAWTASR